MAKKKDKDKAKHGNDNGKMSGKDYAKELRRLQGELCYLQ